jgi:hypothetical protein
MSKYTFIILTERKIKNKCETDVNASITESTGFLM